MVEGVGRYSECVRRGRSCDGAGVPMNASECVFRRLSVISCWSCVVSRITQELQRLKQREREEEDRLEELLTEMQTKVTESQNRLKRLRSQKRVLHDKGIKIVNHGLKSLDELEEVERVEAEAVVAVQANGGFGVVDWSALELPEGLD